MTLPRRISEKLLSIAEERVRVLRAERDDCPFADKRRRERLSKLLWEAQAGLEDKRQMVAFDLGHGS